MAQTGKLIVRTFISHAQLPVPNATVIVSVPDNGRQKLLAIQKTNESGIAEPITLSAPDTSESLTPGNNGTAFSIYTLVVEHPDYQLAVFENLQIFPGIETVQDVALIPLSPAGPDQPPPTLITPQPL